MKKIFIFVFLSILTFTSCQKETKILDKNPLQSVQKEKNVMVELKAKAVKYRTSIEQIYPLVLAKRKVAVQNIEKLTFERKQFLNKPQVTSGANLTRISEIHVPGDYLTLQAAVNNSIEGGKIIVDGTVMQSGNVMVDVANLTIQGEGKDDEASSTIKDDSKEGDNLVVTASGVTIKNLKLLDLGIVINNAENENLMNLHAVSSNPGIFSAFALFGSNNCAVRNCEISYSVLGTGGVSGIGIFLDDFSNNNEVANCKVSNTQFAGFGIEGSDNSIKNCEAVNFYRGFISFDGISTGNVYTGCIANHSYADAGFVFLNFSPNNTTVTLKNCVANDNVAFASIVDIGGSVIISNCTTNANTRNIVGNNPGGMAFLGIGQAGEFVNISKCTANLNATGGIGILDMNFVVTNNTCSKNLQVVSGQGIALGLFNTIGAPMTGSILKNVVESNINNAIGILLSGITNSTITNNRAMNNAVCDFDQTNCSGNTLTNNKFGTSCTGL